MKDSIFCRMGRGLKRAFMAWLTCLPLIPFAISLYYFAVAGTDYEWTALAFGFVLLLPISLVALCVLLPLCCLSDYLFVNLAARCGMQSYVSAAMIFLFFGIILWAVIRYRYRIFEGLRRMRQTHGEHSEH